MTAQFNDTVRYADADWHLAGVNGGELFDPARHGVAVRPAGSACWRGFICSYAIADGELRLDDVHLATEGAAPALLGRAPSAGRQTLGFTASYRALAHVVDFTGGLLLGRDFIRELYVHMGFHPAWKYRHVVEVKLDQGRITSVVDCSEAMAAVRDKLTASASGPGGGATHDEIRAWVERTFSRRY